MTYQTHSDYIIQNVAAASDGPFGPVQYTAYVLSNLGLAEITDEAELEDDLKRYPALLFLREKRRACVDGLYRAVLYLQGIDTAMESRDLMWLAHQWRDLPTLVRMSITRDMHSVTYSRLRRFIAESMRIHSDY